MKRVLREVVLGAVSCVATIGVGSGAPFGISAAFAQDATPPAETAAPVAPPPAGPSARGAAAPALINVNIPIRRIVVEGNQRIEASTVLSYMLLRPGDLFDPEKIDLSLKTLFATGLFADVQISQRDADLVVAVVENPIINKVVFEGVKALKQENLDKELQAKPRSVFTAARAQADVQRIIELYRRSGRFAATVTPQVRELDQNRVDLIFEVEEGTKTGVRSINFIGNKAFSDRNLREAIVTQQSKWWKFLSSNTNYDPDRMDYDREKLRQYYTNRGYADFRVVSAVAELTPDQKGFYITFTVDEGERFKFGDIRVETQLSKVSPATLKSVIPIHSGREYEGDLIEKAIDAITFSVGTSGYANVDVRPRIERDRKARRVNIVFEVNEGPRVFIERINVIGNNRTTDPVIRRELRIAEGDAFNRVLLDRSKSRVRALGYFKEVDVTDRPGSQPDRGIIDVKVKEDATGELALAAGYSSYDNLLLDASITERNLRGKGQFVKLQASTSRRREQIELQFTEPRFLGRNLAAGFDLFSLHTDFLDESSFENQATGGTLRASFPITERTSLGLSYTLRQDHTEVSNALISLPTTGGSTLTVGQCELANPTRSVICDQQGTFLTSVLGYAFNWDKRNDAIKPTRGFDVSFSQDFAGVGGDVKYIRSSVSGGVYYGLTKNFIASLTGSAGYISAWGGDDVRINDRFFKGGSSFRGFDVAGMGPRQLIDFTDSTGALSNIRGNALGGKAFAIGTAQMEFPLGLPKEYGLSAAAFSDFGTVGLLDPRDKRGTFATLPDGSTTRSYVEDSLALRVSVGVSIFWDSPFGPVQFDLADPIVKEPYDRSKVFRFSTRTRF